MSGRGRKQPNRGGKARRPQPASQRSAAPSRTPKAAAPAQRQQQPARPTTGTRSGDTQPVTGARPPRRPPAGSSASGSRDTRRRREERKKRNQRLGVVIGAVALGGAAIGSVIAGMAGESEPSAQPPSASSSPAPSSGAEAVAATAGPTAPAAPSSVVPMAISCPTGAGASPLFGHDIVVPEPYTITIDYGDGDVYTNDSDNLDAIFSHTYGEPGTYTVTAEITSSAGGTATSTCDYTWGP